jgi:hypothetical protein
MRSTIGIFPQTELHSSKKKSTQPSRRRKQIKQRDDQGSLIPHGHNRRSGVFSNTCRLPHCSFFLGDLYTVLRGLIGQRTPWTKTEPGCCRMRKENGKTKARRHVQSRDSMDWILTYSIRVEQKKRDCSAAGQYWTSCSREARRRTKSPNHNGHTRISGITFFQNLLPCSTKALRIQFL